MKKRYWLLLALAVIYLQGCGGDDGGGGQSDLPLAPSGSVPPAHLGNFSVSFIDGLFNTVQVDSTVSPATPSKSFGETMWVPSAKGVTGEDIRDANCSVSGDSSSMCTMSIIGDKGGSTDVSIKVEITEQTPDHLHGTLLFGFDFKGMTDTSKAACTALKVDGNMECLFDFDASKASDSMRIDFTGECNTQKSPGGMLQVVTSDEPHTLGFNLKFDMALSSPLPSQSKPVIEKKEITGIASIDGINYSLEDLRKLPQEETECEVPSSGAEIGGSEVPAADSEAPTGGGTVTAGGTTTGGEEELAWSVPAEIASLLESTCSARPADAAQVLLEEDEGGTLPGNLNLYANNIAGMLRIEPSTDGNLRWAARKWVLASTEGIANTAMGNVNIEPSTDNGVADVFVNHPYNVAVGTHYEVCLVITVPNATVGSITASNQEGSISVTADSRVGVGIFNASGDVTYLLSDGGVPLQADSYVNTKGGSINLQLAPTVGLDLSAITNGGGAISAPPTFPLPTLLNGVRSLHVDLNRGGQTLSLDVISGVGGITIIPTS